MVSSINWRSFLLVWDTMPRMNTSRGPYRDMPRQVFKCFWILNTLCCDGHFERTQVISLLCNQNCLLCAGEHPHLRIEEWCRKGTPLEAAYEASWCQVGLVRYDTGPYLGDWPRQKRKYHQRCSCYRAGWESARGILEAGTAMQLKQCKVEKMCSSNCNVILYFILSVIIWFLKCWWPGQWGMA